VPSGSPAKLVAEAIELQDQATAIEEAAKKNNG
jgi:hypothetical protein